MNSINQQTEILSELCNLMHISAKNGYEEAACRFDYRVSNDGSRSVRAEFWYVLENEKVSKALAYPDRKKLTYLIPELHKTMMAHTGGDWSGFTLTMNQVGEAKTHFTYPKLK